MQDNFASAFTDLYQSYSNVTQAICLCFDRMDMELRESVTALVGVFAQGVLYIFNTGGHNALLLSFERELLGTLFPNEGAAASIQIGEEEKDIIEGIGKSNVPRLFGGNMYWIRINLMKESRAKYLALVTDPAWKAIIEEDTSKIIAETMTEGTISEILAEKAYQRGCASDTIVVVIDLTKF
eukprot:TRINITY_DN5140_c0_g4_i1.p2 TRINITY_DN5140_c0_g4~~TRINITY_DN5140_c0_g4_i1.p2  ORF type:complete len:182 (-),score=13.22 TRINITY_DN5140_c0_g4_i1:119-664(-)